MKLHLYALLFFVGVFVVPAQKDRWHLAMTRAQSDRQAGRMEEARQAYDEALLATASDESLKFQRAVTIGERASLLHDLQKTREAEKGYQEARTMLRRAPPSKERDRYLLILMVNLATLYLEFEQPSKALALGIEELLSTSDGHAGAAKAYSILGAVNFVRRRLPEAEAHWMKALAVADPERTAEDEATLLSNLGVVASERHDRTAAIAYHRRAVESFKYLYGLEHPSTVKAQANLGHELLEAGKRQEALEFLERAYRVAQRWYGDDNVIAARLCVFYAEALQKAGRRQEAKAHFEKVRQLPPSVISALRGGHTVDVLALPQR